MHLFRSVHYPNHEVWNLDFGFSTFRSKNSAPTGENPITWELRENGCRPVPAELVVACLPAAHPAIPARRFDAEPGPRKARRTDRGPAGLFPIRPLLLGRNARADLLRRDRDEFFIHPSAANQVAIERRAAFAQQVLDPVLAPQAAQ